MIFGNLFALGTQPNLVIDIFRNLFFFIDGIVYSLIPLVYSAIFHLYDIRTLFNNGDELQNIVKNFSRTIYSFLAIFMFFRTAVSLLTMLVDPSKIDDKEQGARKIIVNIFLTLALIVAVPWIFDKAKDLQAKIMEDHIIEKMIIGNDFSENENYSLGHEIALSTWSVFLNPTDGANRSVTNAYNDLFNNKKSIGLGAVWPVTKLFAVLNSTSGIPIVSDIIGKIFTDANGLLQTFGAGTHYQLSYVWLLSTIVGVYVLSAFFNLMIDVAYRSIKFFVLELVSPIAIISYIDPSSSKKGLFSKWSKETISTYLSLFIRIFVFSLATVLLRAFNLSNIGTGNSFVQKTGNTLFVKLFYVIALVAFIKNAPKFLDELFGTKMSKESDTKAGRQLFTGLLGGGVSTVAGGISGAVAAGKTGKSVFKGAVTGAWTSGKKGFDAGKKGLVGVVTSGFGAVNDQKKKYGYEIDKERERLINQMEEKVDAVDAAKKAAVNGLDANGGAAYRKILSDGATYNGRKYGKGLENDDKLNNTIKKNLGGLTRDEMLHADDEEYLRLRRLVYNQKNGEALATRTLELAQDDFQTNTNAYQNSSDKGSYIVSFAKQTALANYGEMDMTALRNEFEAQLRLKQQNIANSKMTGFSRGNINHKIDLVVNEAGIDRARASSMSEAELTAEYTKFLQKETSSAIASGTASFDSAAADQKLNIAISQKEENLNYEVSNMSEAQMDAKFTKENAERIKSTYGHSIGDIAADAAKAQGDAKAAQDGLDDYLKVKGKKAKDIDSAYAAADTRHKAKKQEEARRRQQQNNNGNNTP